jgi:hypothetical protein
MKKVTDREVCSMFADDHDLKLKNLDLYVNIIYKEGMQNILKVLKLDSLIIKAPFPLRRMYCEFEQTVDEWFVPGLMFMRNTGEEVSN